jgi:hypothetical protein
MPYVFQTFDGEIEDSTVPDGGRVNVRLHMMDSVQTEISKDSTAIADALETARSKKNHDLQNAWRNPVPTVSDPNDPNQPFRAQALAPSYTTKFHQPAPVKLAGDYKAVSDAELDRVYDKRDRETSEFWRTPAPRMVIDDTNKKVITPTSDGSDPHSRRDARDKALENAWRG